MLTEQDRAEFAERGVVRLRGAFSPDAAARMRRRVWARLASPARPSAPARGSAARARPWLRCWPVSCRLLNSPFVYLSPLPSWLVVAGGRVAAALTEAILVAATTYGIISAFVPLRYRWNPAALLPAVLLVLTVIGFSLVIAGMTIRWKRIQMINDTVLLAAMIFSASAVPLLHVPRWMAATGRYFPVTHAIASLYGVMLGHRSITAPSGPGGLIWVLVTAAAYLAAGITAFRLLERAARTRGTLASY